MSSSQYGCCSQSVEIFTGSQNTAVGCKGIAEIDKLRIIANYTYHWEFWRDGGGRLVWVSPACESVTGYNTQEYILRSESILESIMAPPSRETWVAHENFVRDNRDVPSEVEVLIRKRSGEQAWILHTCRPIYDDSGAYLGRRGCNIDITHRKNMEQALVRSETLLRTTIDSIFDGIVVANARLCIEHVNHQICSMFDISENFVGKSVWSFFQKVCCSASDSSCSTMLSALNGDIFSLSNYVFPTKSGKCVAVSSRRTVDDSQYSGWIWSFRDVTAIKRHEEMLSALARTDALTGVGNRREFCTRAQREFTRCKRYGTDLSLLVLDIDRFKSINDRYGHDAGDTVLVAIARTCETLLRGSDAFCRIGGEEFAVLLVQSDAQQGMLTAARLHRAIGELCVPSGDSTIRATVSIGVASADPGHEAFEGLLKDADRALYAAKSQGRNRICAAFQADVPEQG